MLTAFIGFRAKRVIKWQSEGCLLLRLYVTVGEAEWLKSLPTLKPTNILAEHKPYISCGTSKNKGNKDKAGVSRAGGSQKIRSKTFEGIAAAVAEQWG